MTNPLLPRRPTTPCRSALRGGGRSQAAFIASEREAEAAAVAAAAELVSSGISVSSTGKSNSGAKQHLLSFVATSPERAQEYHETFARRRFQFSSGVDENTDPAGRRLNSLAAGAVLPQPVWKQIYSARASHHEATLMEVSEGSSLHTSPLAEHDVRVCKEAASLRNSVDLDSDQAAQLVVPKRGSLDGAQRAPWERPEGRPPVAKLSEMPEWAEAFQQRRRTVSQWSGSERGGLEEQSEPESAQQSRNPSVSQVGSGSNSQGAPSSTSTLADQHTSLGMMAATEHDVVSSVARAGVYKAHLPPPPPSPDGLFSSSGERTPKARSGSGGGGSSTAPRMGARSLRPPLCPLACPGPALEC